MLKYLHALDGYSRPGPPSRRDGIVTLTQARLKDRIRETLSGPSLVDTLLNQRRREASQDDPETNR